MINIQKIKIMNPFILRLTIRFLSITQVLDMWNSNIITKEDVSFYICEKFDLKNNKNFQVLDDPYKTIKTDNEATWDRIYNDDTLKERILNNRFLNDNARLKSRIYLAIKRNDQRLMNYYYDNYALVKKNNIKTITIDRSTATKLYEIAPMRLDDREMMFIDHILTIKNKHNITICVVYPEGNIELLNSPETMDLEFLLQLPDSMVSIYNNIHPKKRLRGGEHRRPKIKIRKLF